MHYLCMQLACHGSDAGYDKVEKYVCVDASGFQVNAIGTFKDYHDGKLREEHVNALESSRQEHMVNGYNTAGISPQGFVLAQSTPLWSSQGRVSGHTAATQRPPLRTR